MTGIAKRRHHRERVLNKRKNYDGRKNKPLGAMDKGGSFCSCEMCANPRRSKKDPPSYRLTPQELRDRITVKEEINYGRA